MSRYDNIVAELAQRVPELAEECQPTVTTFLERCQLGQTEPSRRGRRLYDLSSRRYYRL